MGKKKTKKRNAGPPQSAIRLSQCMIVRNEEKNIERALAWAKKIAFEQIVVDTGSTDRTIEIADKMGARVLHFEWVDDFSAAKNFAIEQAKGNWIALLDADEYFSPGDADKLMIFLKRIQADPFMRANYLALNSALVNVDENGKRGAVQDQERVFRNIPANRYIGRIHERLDVKKENIVAVDEIEIIHTGYSAAAIRDKNKAGRNVMLLREELASNPDDLNIKSYLADSLKMSDDEKDKAEADKLFAEVMESGELVLPDLLKKAYLHFIAKIISDPDKAEECAALCKKACRAVPGDKDLEGLYAQLSAGRRQNDEVRLSQCMIVKNEEKHIERALNWAKDIAFEQIVVDTGSTDRTVELAEKMGAKVYHFEWIDDFASAKNFAMDKATGSWIAIFDADEYMSHEDAEKLIAILSEYQSSPDCGDTCEALGLHCVNLDDNGNIVSIERQCRIFRNLPHLRYAGRIHENVILTQGKLRETDLRMYHTGYSKSVVQDTNKLERNISMLRKEYELDRKNPDTMIYLANSLQGLETEEAFKEAEKLNLEALAGKRPANPSMKQRAYDFLIPRFILKARFDSSDEKRNEAMRLCNEAIMTLPENPDYLYYRAVLSNQTGNHKAAMTDLSKCEKLLAPSEKLPTTRILAQSPLPLYYQMTVAAEGLGDKEKATESLNIIENALTQGREQTADTGPYIRAMSWYGASYDDILKSLSAVYDIENPKDMMLIARAAKDNGAIEFSRYTMTLTKNLLVKPEE